MTKIFQVLKTLLSKETTVSFGRYCAFYILKFNITPFIIFLCVAKAGYNYQITINEVYMLSVMFFFAVLFYGITKLGEIEIEKITNASAKIIDATKKS